MAASETDISNIALIRCGSAPITSLSASTREAILCNYVYDLSLETLLSLHPWNCAIARVELALSASTPEFEFDYQFVLPSDVGRILETDLDDGDDWQREGMFVLADVNEMSIKYLKNTLSVAHMPPYFADTLSWKMAKEMVYSLTQKAEKEKLVIAEYERAFSFARLCDAQEGFNKDLDARDWVRARE